MNCPEYKSKDENDNFCCSCTVSLKEKCSERVAMKITGKKVCKKKLEEAESALRCFSFNIFGFRVIGSMLTIILSIVGTELSRPLGIYVFELWRLTVQVVWPALLTIIIHTAYFTDPEKPSKKLREIFARRNPHYAEILAKEEGGNYDLSKM